MRADVTVFGRKFSNIDVLANSLKMKRSVVEYRLNRLIPTPWCMRSTDLELLFSIEYMREIQLELVGIDNVARYKVTWSEQLQTTRQVIEHYRPELLDLYDKSNPTGTWHPIYSLK